MDFTLINGDWNINGKEKKREIKKGLRLNTERNENILTALQVALIVTFQGTSVEKINKSTKGVRSGQMKSSAPFMVISGSGSEHERLCSEHRGNSAHPELDSEGSLTPPKTLC